MRLTKEEFCAAVNKYEQMCKEESEIIKTLGCSPDWKLSNWLGEYYNLLRIACDLSETETDLAYYCYDLNFGKNWKPESITIDGKDIPCRNVEELWNLIMFDGDPHNEEDRDPVDKRRDVK